MLKLVQRLCVVVGAGLVVALGGCRPAADVAAPLPQASKALLSHATAQGAVQFTLTDRNTTSGVPINSDRFLVEAYTIKPASIAAVTAYVTGPAELSVEGGSPVQASEQGWVTIPLLPPPVMPVERVVIAVKPLSGVTVSINEIELWSAGGTTAWRPLAMMVSSANAQDPGLALMRPEPDHGNLFPADTSDAYGSAPTCMDVVFDVAADPAAFARVAFTYEATGLAGSFSLLRAVNGLGAVGGYALSATSNMTRYVEHIPTAHLARGINRLHLCGPQAGTQTIRLQSMMLIAEAERNLAWFGTADMLTDGEGSTAASVTARDFAFTRPSKVVGVMVHHAGDADVQVMLDGQPAVIRDRVRGANGTMLWLDSPPAASVATINAGGATLSEVHWLGSPVGTASTPRLVFNHPQHGEYFGNQAVITGFVDGAAIGTLGQVLLASEHINPVEVATVNGVFGALVFRLPAEQPKDTWWVDVTVVMTDGARLAEGVVFLGDALPGSTGTTGRATSGQDPEVERAHYGLEGDSVNGTVTPGHGGDIRLGDRVGVSVPGGAVATDTVITVKRPSRHALPALNPGMVNVTAPRDAFYQFLPPGTRFAQPVTITVPYDPSLIPQGKGPQDVKTFYFDGSQRQFVALERAHVDTNSETVVSLTDHFTDMINAVLVEPESPAPTLFNPNQVASMAVADPTANMTLIAPPTPNKDGTANLSYPFTLPKARGRYQPQLALSYTSEGGWGLAGEGWNVSVSSVDVETRFGAPRYEMHNGSPVPGKPPVGERYLLDGQQLVPADNDPSAACRDGSETQRFVFRKEGAFMRILRCGTNDANYHWEVTDKNGNWMLYGLNLEAREADPAPIGGCPTACQQTDRNIGRWLLEKVRDANNNETWFHYLHDESCCDLLKTPWTSRLLKSIEYTVGINDNGDSLPAGYKVELSYGTRTDVNVTARMGFKSVKDKILTDVKVWCTGACSGSDALIRQYKLGHAAASEDTLFKTLLTSVTACDNHGCDYVPPPLPDGGPAPAPEAHTTTFKYEPVDAKMGDAEPWVLPEGDLIPLQASLNGGVNGQGGVGVNLASAGRVKGSVGVAGSVSGNVGAGTTISLFMDINGDGLPDHFIAPADLERGQQIVASLGKMLNVSIPNPNRSVAFNKGKKSDVATQAAFAFAGHGEEIPGDKELRGTGALPPVLGLDISGGANASLSGNAGVEMYSVTENVSVGANMSGSLVFPTDIDGDGLVDFAGPIPLFQVRNGGVVEFKNVPGTQSVQDCVPFAPDMPAEGDEKPGTMQTGIPELVKRITEGTSKRDVVWRWRAPKAGTITAVVHAAPLIDCDVLASQINPPTVEVMILPRTLLPVAGEALPDLPFPSGFEEILNDLLSRQPPAGLPFNPMELGRDALAYLKTHWPALPDAPSWPMGTDAPVPLRRDSNDPDVINGVFDKSYRATVVPGAEVYVRIAAGDSCISELAGGALDTVLTNINITYETPAPTPSPLTSDDDTFDSAADFRVVGMQPHTIDHAAPGAVLTSGRVSKQRDDATQQWRPVADYVDVSLVQVTCTLGNIKRDIMSGGDDDFFPSADNAIRSNVLPDPDEFGADLVNGVKALKSKVEKLSSFCSAKKYPIGTLTETAHEAVAHGQLQLRDINISKGDKLIILVKGRSPIDPNSVRITEPFKLTETDGTVTVLPVDVTWRRLTVPSGVYESETLPSGGTVRALDDGTSVTGHRLTFSTFLWPGFWMDVPPGSTEDEALPHLVIQTPGRVLKRVVIKPPPGPLDQFCSTLLREWTGPGCPPDKSYCTNDTQKIFDCKIIPCVPSATSCPAPFDEYCEEPSCACPPDAANRCFDPGWWAVPPHCFTAGDVVEDLCGAANPFKCPPSDANGKIKVTLSKVCSLGGAWCETGEQCDHCPAVGPCCVGFEGTPFQLTLHPTCNCGDATLKNFVQNATCMRLDCPTNVQPPACSNPGDLCTLRAVPPPPCVPSACGSCNGALPCPDLGRLPEFCPAVGSASQLLTVPCIPGSDSGGGCDQLLTHITSFGCSDAGLRCTDVPLPTLVSLPFSMNVDFDVPVGVTGPVFVSIEPPAQALISMMPELWNMPDIVANLARLLLDTEVGPPYPVERWLASQAFIAATLTTPMPFTLIKIDDSPADFNVLAPEASFGLPLPIQVLSWWGVAMSEGYRGWGYGEWQRKLELPGAAPDQLTVPFVGSLIKVNQPLFDRRDSSGNSTSPKNLRAALDEIKGRLVGLFPKDPAALTLGSNPISGAVALATGNALPGVLADAVPSLTELQDFLPDLRLQRPKSFHEQAQGRMDALTKLVTPPDFMPRIRTVHAGDDRYNGSCSGAYVAAGVSQPGRCNASAPIEIPGLKLPAPPLGDIREKVQQLIACPTGAPRTSASANVSVGGSLTIVGGSNSLGMSTGITDYRDMTGDGIPDTVIMTPLGLMVLRAERGAPHGVPAVLVPFFGEQQRLSFNANIGVQRNDMAALAHVGVPFSASPSQSLSFNADAVTLIDMNGDGLADLVSAIPLPNCDGLSVRLNLGTRFANPPDCWSGYTAFLPLPTADMPGPLTQVATRIPKALNVGASLSTDVQVSLGLSFINPRLSSVHSNFSVNVSVQFDELTDVNGDGLPDRVFSLGIPTPREEGGQPVLDGPLMFVQMNSGHGFESVKLWAVGNKVAALNTLLSGQTFPTSPVSLASDGQLVVALPDGKYAPVSLPGVSTRSIGILTKKIFGNLFSLPQPDGTSEVQRNMAGVLSNIGSAASSILFPQTLNTSVTLSASAGGGIDLPPRVQIGPPGATITVNGGGGGNASITFTDTMFVDVNGDGLPDPIQRIAFVSDGLPRAAILVHPNRAGTGNRLKSVTNPLGGSFELTYGEEGNTFEMPSHKYVLKGVVKHSKAYNGITAAGLAQERPVNANRASDTAERISYRDGRYDRHNKEFLGFGTVIVEELDGPDGALRAAALRTTCQEYHNTQFETAGQLRKTVRAKAVATGAPEEACVLNKLDEELHEYHDLKVVQTPRGDCITPAPLPANACTSTVSHELSIHKISYEGSTSTLDSSEEFSTYDAYGNITLYKDYGDAVDASDDIWATTMFEPPSAEHYLPSLQSRFTVGELKAGGKILRAREGEYTPVGLMTVYRVFDGAGHQLETRRVWSGNGNIKSITAPTGYTKTYVFDDTTATYPVLVEGRMGSADGPLDQSASRTWDLAHGVMLTETDANGGTLTFTYDEFGLLNTVTAPGESKPDITMSYAGKRAITIHKAPPGVEVSDPLDLAIPTAPVTIQAVDGLGQPVWTAKTAVVDGAPTYAVANRALKDGLGRPRVAGLVQAVSFAALASLVTADASAALFAPTRTDVDDKDRPTYVYEPQAAPSEGSRVSRKEYSAANGRLRTDAYDPKGNHTATVQDSAGNTVEVWEYNGAEIGTVTYVFDALKQVTRIEDAERPNPNVTTITYDGLGRQSSVTTPDTGTTTFEYDSVGRLKKKIDARGKEVVNNYEPGSSRVVSITRTGETRDYTFTYGLEGDANRATGRILRSQDEDGEETYVYNALGATTKITRKLLTDEVFETTFDYDSFNRVRSITYPDGEVVQYQYDAAGQVRHAASTQALYVSGILYDELGQRKTVTYGNGVVENFTIDPYTRRVTGIKSGAFQDLTLVYDDVNNITSITDPGSLSRSLEYDALNRLTSDRMRVTAGDGTYKQHISTFTFDKLHRMRTQVQDVSTEVGAVPADSHNWTYQYARTPHAVSGVTGPGTLFEYRHDLAGNMEYSKQGSDVRNISWTADGFEREHRRGASTTTYSYDSNAQRRAKNVDGVVTHYLGPHVTKSAVGLSKHVFVGQQRVATAIGDNRVFYHTDHIGTTSVLTDKDGAIRQKVWLYTYGSEFHHVDGTSLALMDQRFLLTGKEWDAESGDYYFGWRYLASDIATWRSADPEWAKQGPAGLSLYLPMAGNPVRNVDPDGRALDDIRDYARVLWGGEDAWQESDFNDYNENPTAHTAGLLGTLAGGSVIGGLIGGGTAGVVGRGVVGGTRIAAAYATNGAVGGTTLAADTAAVVETAAVLGGETAVAGGVKAGCFVSGTLVAVPGGRTPIEGIHVGDIVKAYDPLTEQVADAVVENVFTTLSDHTIEISLEGGVEIVTTSEHPFWVVQKGWAPARAITVDDVLLQSNGQGSVVERVRITDSSVQVFNISVNSVHTFFVSSDEVLVHNKAARDLRFPPVATPKAAVPYKRPSGSTTPAQRASVQGKPCVKCGAEAKKMVAGHKNALVKEHYETGTIDKEKMRAAGAVQPECPTCSAREGADMSRYSREQKALLEGKEQ